MSTPRPSIMRYCAWTAQPPDGPEYVIGFSAPGLGFAPAVYHNANSQVVIDAMRQVAVEHAKKTGYPVSLKEFSLYRVCEVIGPEAHG